MGGYPLYEPAPGGFPVPDGAEIYRVTPAGAGRQAVGVHLIVEARAYVGFEKMEVYIRRRQIMVSD